jgi:hypothetical protein
MYVVFVHWLIIHNPKPISQLLTDIVCRFKMKTARVQEKKRAVLRWYIRNVQCGTVRREHEEKEG